ncbi:MAG: DUF4349 domain-containing protein [Acidimicrobiia bacterium]
MKRITVVLVAIAVIVIGGVVGTLAGLPNKPTPQPIPVEPQPIPVEQDSSSVSGPASHSSKDLAPGATSVPGVIAPIPLTSDGDGSALARSASLRVFSKDVRTTADRVRSIIETNSGTIYSLSLRRDELLVTARIPMAKYTEVTAALSGTGSIEAFTTNVADVSASIASIDAALKNLQAQEQTLTDRINTTKDAETLARLRQELADVRTSIDTTNAQRRTQQYGVETFSLDVVVANTHADTPRSSEPSMLTKAAAQAGEIFLTVTGGLLIISGALAPLVAVVLVLLLAARLGRRMMRRNPSLESVDIAQ